MSIPTKSILIFIFLLFTSIRNFAQPQNDFRMVTGFSIEKKLSRSFSFSFLNNEIFNQNLNELGVAFADAGVNYKLNRHFSFGVNYRFVKRKNLENFYDDRQMIYVDAAYSKYYSRFSFSVRSRFQVQYYPKLFSLNYRAPQIYNRNNITLRYKINYYLNPYISVENFMNLNATGKRILTDIRYTAGCFFNINDFFKTEFYYSIDNGLNRVSRINYFTTGVICYFKF